MGGINSHTLVYYHWKKWAKWSGLKHTISNQWGFCCSGTDKVSLCDGDEANNGERCRGSGAQLLEAHPPFFIHLCHK